MKFPKKSAYAFTMFATCFVSAAATLIFLSGAARAAKMRVMNQYVAPDYVRYLSQGYAFDAITEKKNILMTVTDDDTPVHIHIITIDTSKHTIDIFDLPPESYVVADGFTGTLKDAYETSVYRDIVTAVLCLKIDAEISMDANALGGVAGLLHIKLGRNSISYEDAEKTVLDGSAYIKKDEKPIKEYYKLLGLILTDIAERGTLESFSKLMNLIANKVDGGFAVEEVISFFEEMSLSAPKKMNIRLAPGAPAKYGENIIWCLDADGVANILNQNFRVKDVEYPSSALSIPVIEAGENPYKNLEEKVSEIIK